MSMRFVFLLCVFPLFCVRSEVFYSSERIAQHLEGYTCQERECIEKDLEVVRSVCDPRAHSLDAPLVYLATAGAPGSRKTTILERFLDSHREYEGIVYLDYDPRTLKCMSHTYQARGLNALAIARDNDYGQTIRKAYEKWRAASHYITLTLLEEAFAARRSVAFGTTSTGDHTAQFLRAVKQAGYRVVLLLCSCPDAVRQECVRYRNDEVRFYQSSSEDVLVKGDKFAQRMPEYFAHADTIYMYWSEARECQETLAAVWEDSSLQVLDPEAFACFKMQYEQVRNRLRDQGVELETFDACVHP